MALVGLEGSVRAAQNRSAGTWASRLSEVMLLLVVLAAAAGLALLVGGHRPREWLHFIYAALTLGAVPVSDSIVRRFDPRGGGLGRAIGALVGLVLIWRLFTTG